MVLPNVSVKFDFHRAVSYRALLRRQEISPCAKPRAHLDSTTTGAPDISGVPDSAPASWSGAVPLPLLSGAHSAEWRGDCLQKKKRQKDSRTPRRWRVVGHPARSSGFNGANHF